MRKLILLVFMCLPLMAAAQNEWEQLEEDTKTTKANPDEKYLVGAVPVVDGRVTFTTELSAPGKSADQVFSIISDYLTKMTKQKNQFEQSQISLKDSVKHMICGSYQEWLVFKNKPLVLDRTRLFYNLIAECGDGKAKVTMTRIYYLYDEERNPLTLKAEEWITDEYGLKKNKKKLSRISGKFRRKTIDRKDYIFNKLNELLNE